MGTMLNTVSGSKLTTGVGVLARDGQASRQRYTSGGGTTGSSDRESAPFTVAVAAAASSFDRALISPMGWPDSSQSPTLGWNTMPTAGSMGSPFLIRPAPSDTAARPIASA